MFITPPLIVYNLTVFISDHEDRAVHKVLFLDRRAHLCKTAATLVASGPCGT